MTAPLDSQPQTPAWRVCRSCGHTAPAADFMPDRKFNWEPIPGSFVCSDADACFGRWLARERAAESDWQETKEY